MDEMLLTADTQPQVSTEAAEDTAADAAAPPEADAFEVKFNKQTHTLSRQDAIRYAQLGMKHETVEPLLLTLKEVAAREGKTLKEWVGTLSERPAPADPLAARLAEEYETLHREVPEAGTFEELPAEAVRQSVEEGIPLMDAYLRYAYRERRRTEAARASQQAAAAAATPSLADGAVAYASPAESAMMRGVWGQ